MGTGKGKKRVSSWFPGRQVSSHLLALWPGAVTCKSFKYPHFRPGSLIGAAFSVVHSSLLSLLHVV